MKKKIRSNNNDKGCHSRRRRRRRGNKKKDDDDDYVVCSDYTSPHHHHHDDDLGYYSRNMVAIHVRVKAALASTTISQAKLKLAYSTMNVCIISIHKKEKKRILGQGLLKTATANKPRRRRRLSSAARALLPTTSSVKSTSSDDEDIDAAASSLESILRRASILKSATVQCMIDSCKQARVALLELTPAKLSLTDFMQRCAGHPDATVLYNVVCEAIEQCQDMEEYYQQGHVFKPHQRFSARTLPPLPCIDPDDDVLMDLNCKFWDSESMIDKIHEEQKQRQPHAALDPGFAVECVAMLCHAYEAGHINVKSPIGLNLFELDSTGVVATADDSFRTGTQQRKPASQEARGEKVGT